MSAAIVKNGKVVCTAVAGMADTSAKRPVTPDTAFTWASVSKTITGSALMILFDHGKFQLDDDISQHIGFKPDLPTCPGKPLTIRQVLTHTAGISDGGPDPYVPGDSPVTLEEYVKGWFTAGSQYYTTKNSNGCPNLKFEYSNFGGTMIGYLTEKISGEDYAQFAKDKVFSPLGMDNTSFRIKDIDQSRYALPGGNKQFQGDPQYPADSLITSPSNLGNFLIVHMNGGAYNGVQLLKSTTVQEIVKNQSQLDPDIGLLWDASTDFDGGATTWGHNGDDNGVKTEMRFNPGTKTGVAVAANGDDAAAVTTVMNKLFQEAASY